MSASSRNPWSLLFMLGEPESRPALTSFVIVAIVLGIARVSGPGELYTSLAVAVLLGVPLLGSRTMSDDLQRVFFIVSAMGAWLVFRVPGEPSPPVVLVGRLAYFAVPPLVADLLLTEADRDRLHIGLVHLYAPAVVMAIGSIVHLAMRSGARFEEGEREIRRAALIYAGCYLVLLVVGVIARAASAPARRPKPDEVKVERGEALEERGRHGMAARVYEREGQVEKGAQAAERAGDWERAARLHRRAGDEFQAGEMFFRAQMWTEALESYERAQSWPAAARLCLQLGQVDRAVDLFEKAGDPAAVVRTLEEAGRQPTLAQYRRAGQLEKAAMACRQAGDIVKAAEIYEHEIRDEERAALMYAKAGRHVQAARLMEAQGDKQRALKFFLADPAGAMDAVRIYLSTGRAKEAAELLGRLPPADLAKIEDEATLDIVARVMLEGGRNDEAARILQGIKRGGQAGGATRLLLGRAFLAKGLEEPAEAELRVAAGMPLDPADQIEASYLLGCVLEAAGKQEEALRTYYDVLEKDMQYKDVEERYRRLKAKATATPSASVATD